MILLSNTYKYQMQIQTLVPKPSLGVDNLINPSTLWKASAKKCQ